VKNASRALGANGRPDGQPTNVMLSAYYYGRRRKMRQR